MRFSVCSFTLHAASMYLVMAEFERGWCRRRSPRSASIWKTVQSMSLIEIKIKVTNGKLLCIMSSKEYHSFWGMDKDSNVFMGCNLDISYKIMLDLRQRLYFLFQSSLSSYKGVKKNLQHQGTMFLDINFIINLHIFTDCWKVWHKVAYCSFIWLSMGLTNSFILLSNGSYI